MFGSGSLLFGTMGFSVSVSVSVLLVMYLSFLFIGV